MAWRAKESEVRELLDGVKATDALAPFITTANALTNKVVEEDAGGVLNDALATEIEKYRAAHFAEHKYQQYASESTGGASATFQGQFGQGLSSSKHGQTAMILDITGFLSDLDEGVTEIELEWLGKPPSEQIDYSQRD